ncbi:hypothetical protein [Amycolatopsis nalaikhensis]|uniref:Integral membrane protein n=1 Tax=Amycolatopsis nalaikhensis TaxID=715472 RepID=A0ABY8Y0S7_9PSEU|nr:hypothetical protein [Amycolatopsis sp. 2-2]WIV61599.1 hypothetical protein QP939_24845 [Amycolatopsis sp. 2-2]
MLSQALDGNLIRFTSYRSERAGDGTVLTTTTVAPLPVGVAVFTFLLLGGLWALLVFGMYHGASWARALLAVFAVLGTFVVVGQLIGLAAQDEMNGGDLAHLVFFLATLVLTIAGWVLMYRDGAKPYLVKRR